MKKWRKKIVSNKTISVTIYEEKFPADDSPLATVRYTEYSDHTRRKVEKVVSICTQLSVKTLQKKLDLWTR